MFRSPLLWIWMLSHHFCREINLCANIYEVWNARDYSFCDLIGPYGISDLPVFRANMEGLACETIPPPFCEQFWRSFPSEIRHIDDHYHHPPTSILSSLGMGLVTFHFCLWLFKTMSLLQYFLIPLCFTCMFCALWCDNIIFKWARLVKMMGGEGPEVGYIKLPIICTPLFIEHKLQV